MTTILLSLAIISARAEQPKQNCFVTVAKMQQAETMKKLKAWLEKQRKREK